MERLICLYDDYHAQIRLFKSKMKPADGLFGMGVGLGEAPCHDDFAEKLEALLQAMAADGDFQDSRSVLEFIYQAPLQEPERAAYWMMMAVHRLTLPLINRLEQEDAQQLLAWYKDAYPRKDRLPPQDMVLKALKERSQSSTRSLFGWKKKERRP